MQRLLIDLDLFLKADFGDGDKRLPSIAHSLNFNPDGRVMRHCAGEALFASGSILRCTCLRCTCRRKALAPTGNQTKPYIELAVVDPIWHVSVIDVVKVIELVKAIHPAARRKVHNQLPEAIAAGQQLFSSACSGCHGVKGEGGRGPNLADGHLIRDVNPQLLFGAIRKGVPGTTMPPFDWPDEKIWQALAYVSSLSSPAFAARVPGDPQAGGAIFYGKGGCSDCHTILGRGRFVGPDLSNAGMTHSWKQLRDALLDPASRSRVGFQGVTVTTRSGELTSGVLRNNTNYSLQVQDMRGNLHLFLMQDVREVKYKTKSLMPDDYDRRLTSQEIEDLLAFLSRQALRLPKPPAALEARPKE